MFRVLHLPSWIPGMSFKREMAVTRDFSEQYLDRPFEYALHKVVMVILIAYLVRTLNNYMC
jgi:type III secretory pathway component EscU